MVCPYTEQLTLAVYMGWTMTSPVGIGWTNCFPALLQQTLAGTETGKLLCTTVNSWTFFPSCTMNIVLNLKPLLMGPRTVRGSWAFHQLLFVWTRHERCSNVLMTSWLGCPAILNSFIIASGYAISWSAIDCPKARPFFAGMSLHSWCKANTMMCWSHHFGCLFRRAHGQVIYFVSLLDLKVWIFLKSTERLCTKIF
jgi:hypothetical protein